MRGPVEDGVRGQSEVIDPGTGTLRLVRGAVLAIVCTLLAVAGHAAGDPGPAAWLPPLPALLATGVLIGAAFVVLADRRRGVVRIGLAALVSQLVFHLAFALAGHGGAVPDGRMAGAHVASGLLLTVLAAHGENLVWAVARLFGVVTWVRLIGVRPPIAVRLVARRARFADLPRVLLGARTHPRRGPPAPVCS